MNNYTKLNDIIKQGVDFTKLSNGVTIATKKVSALDEYREYSETLFGSLDVNNKFLQELMILGYELGLTSTQINEIDDEVTSFITESLMEEALCNGKVTPEDTHRVATHIKSAGTNQVIDPDLYNDFIRAGNLYNEYCTKVAETNNIQIVTKATIMSKHKDPRVLDQGALIRTDDKMMFIGDKKTMIISHDVIANTKVNGNTITFMKLTNGSNTTFVLDTDHSEFII